LDLGHDEIRKAAGIELDDLKAQGAACESGREETRGREPAVSVGRKRSKRLPFIHVREYFSTLACHGRGTGVYEAIPVDVQHDDQRAKRRGSVDDD
jgi:hypothetical protein